jgi:hypothetical protein
MERENFIFWFPVLLQRTEIDFMRRMLREKMREQGAHTTDTREASENKDSEDTKVLK